MLRFLLLFLIAFPASAQKRSLYFPPAGTWQRADPQRAGWDTAGLGKAIRFAISAESKAPRSMELMQAQTFGREPYGFAIGPFADRGEPTGVVVHKGYIVASWGNPDAVEMTHSVTKSFLSTVVGLAADRGLIRNVMDPVGPYVPPIEVYGGETGRSADALGTQELLQPFTGPHNSTIRWDDLLRQTSDWEGTLWGKPDWADRPDAKTDQWLNRERKPAGSAYEYNDVRVNLLALATTSVWRRPLPQVLKELVMEPIGASPTWRWTGYRNSWIVLDGQPVQSVSGGGHWGGGLFINAWDMARFGLLTLHEGAWNGRQLISKDWIRRSRIPTVPQPTYGYMNYFLNTDRKFLADAPANAFVHVGNGTNIIYVDPEHQLVVVVRWIEQRSINEFIRLLLEAGKGAYGK